MNPAEPKSRPGQKIYRGLGSDEGRGPREKMAYVGGNEWLEVVQVEIELDLLLEKCHPTTLMRPFDIPTHQQDEQSFNTRNKIGDYVPFCFS